MEHYNHTYQRVQTVQNSINTDNLFPLPPVQSAKTACDATITLIKEEDNDLALSNIGFQ